MERDGARRASGADKQHFRAWQRRNKGLGAIRRRLENALNEAVAVSVVTDQPSVLGSHDRVDGIDPTRPGIDGIEKFHDPQLMRDGDVSAPKPFALSE